MSEAAGPYTARAVPSPLVICAALVVAVVALYWPVRSFDFVDFDDFGYVAANPWVANGVTLDGMLWALTTEHLGYWAPLIWVSHMVDVELFGMDAGAHHLVNVAIHAANGVVLFLLASRVLGSLVLAAWIAAIFAVHPLNVESVAWVTERKNLLVAACWLAAMAFHAAFASSGQLRYRIMTVAAMAVGAMAKATIVTLPFALLLLDVWPLGRLRGDQAGRRNAAGAPWISKPFPLRRFGSLVAEKGPLFAIALVSSALTWHAQASVGAVAESLAFSERLGNALVSYARYLEKLVWPSDLAVLYPFPSLVGRPPDWSSAELAGSIGLLVVISAIAVMRVRRIPELFFGWFWFLGTLVPTIGLVQVGDQAMADRHAYVPMLGPLWAVASLARRGAARGLRSKRVLAVMGVALAIAAAAVTARVLPHWRDTLSLFERAAAVTEGNWIALNNVAWLLATCPDPGVRDGPRAVALAEEAVALTRGGDPQILDTLAAAHAEVGNRDAAARVARRAVDLAIARDERQVAEVLRERMRLYERGHPVRASQGCPAPRS